VGSLYVQLLVGVKGRGYSRTGVRQVGLSESSSNGGGVQPRAMARFKLMSHPWRRWKSSRQTALSLATMYHVRETLWQAITDERSRKHRR
jgi:hypothetical protein